VTQAVECVKSFIEGTLRAEAAEAGAEAGAEAAAAAAAGTAATEAAAATAAAEAAAEAGEVEAVTGGIASLRLASPSPLLTSPPAAPQPADAQNAATFAALYHALRPALRGLSRGDGLSSGTANLHFEHACAEGLFGLDVIGMLASLRAKYPSAFKLLQFSGLVPMFACRRACRLCPCFHSPCPPFPCWACCA
jgi:hypothetical protein